MKSEEAVDKVIDLFNKTRNNHEFVDMVKKIKFF
jgi:transcription termination factor Rho